jgi:glucokinase
MPRVLDRHDLVRRVNERRVIEALLEHGPTSRVHVAEVTGLSKPTVNALVRDLEEVGLVSANGKATGSIGRSAVLYSVDAQSRLAIGVDLGGTKVRAGIADLSGEILAEQMEPTDRQGGRAVLAQIKRLCTELVDRIEAPWSSVQAVGLSAPGVFHPDTGQVDLAFNVPGWGDLNVGKELDELLDVQVILDNDVNLAAIGEKWKGLAGHAEDFAFIAVGTGVGMGLVVNGQLVHGHRRAAGEISYLPIGPDPLHDLGVRKRGAFEEAVAAGGVNAALRDRIKTGIPSSLLPTATVADIFEAAAAGDEAARQVVDDEAQLIARAILTVSSVVDPELFILGGGIGSNPLLLSPVRSYVAEIAPYDIRVETSAIGDRASLYGALAVALQTIRNQILKEGKRHG